MPQSLVKVLLRVQALSYIFDGCSHMPATSEQPLVIRGHMQYCVLLSGSKPSLEKLRLLQKAVLKGPQNIGCDVIMTESGPSADVPVKMGESSLVEDFHLLFLLPRLWHNAPV